MKFMDLFTMFNKPISFIRRLNIENFLFFKLEFSVLVVNYGHHEKIKNFSSISLKLSLLGQTNNTGT